MSDHGQYSQTAVSALQLMREALELLDADNFPADIGAHLDLAIARLDGEMTRHNMLSGEQVPKAQTKAF